MGNKGGSFERDVSKFLTLWLSGKKKPYMFWRNDGSGSLATIHAENYHMTGDICSVHPDSMFFMSVFSVEVKNGYPRTSFWQHWSSSKFGIEEFWEQACHDANKANKHPMLIYRKKGRRQIVGINKYIQERLNKRLDFLNNIVICWGKGSNIESCFLYDMIDFFDSVKPDDIKGILNGDS